MTMNREELAAMLKEREINPNLHYGILAYVFDHHPVGHFLTCFFENDLFGALSRADEKSVKSLVPLMQIVYCYVDGRAHGSKEKVKAWIDGSYKEPDEEDEDECPVCEAPYSPDLGCDCHIADAERDKAIEDKMDERRLGE